MRVLLAGASGFLGRHIAAELRADGHHVLAPRSSELDLLSSDQSLEWIAARTPDAIIHSAAYYGGIGINQSEPANLFFRNTTMAANLFEAAAQAGVKRVIPIGSACAYPGHIHGDLKESDFWEGALHPSVEAYGFSKKLQLVAQRAYHQQYGIESVHLVLTNMFGPFDVFHEYRSHVVSALIKKFVDAKDEVVCWGDGSPIREFLYVGDAAKAIVRALTLPHSIEPVNIGSGVGTSIRELTELIAEITGFVGKITWDTTKPNGVERKVLDVSRMREVLDYTPETSLRDGLASTIEWYRANKEEADQRR